MSTNPRYPVNSGFVGHKSEDKKPDPQPAPTKQRNMVEREAPVLFEFKAPGDCVEGELLAVEKITITDRDTKKPKLVMQYTTAQGENTLKFLGTYDLNCKLRPTDAGKFIEVVFKSTDPSKNNMRLFSVKVEQKSAAEFADGTQITDADIPF